MAEPLTPGLVVSAAVANAPDSQLVDVPKPDDIARPSDAPKYVQMSDKDMELLQAAKETGPSRVTASASTQR